MFSYSNFLIAIEKAFWVVYTSCLYPQIYHVIFKVYLLILVAGVYFTLCITDFVIICALYVPYNAVL